MNFLVDLLPIVLIIILLCIGYKKGFLYMIYSFVSFFVSAFIAWLLYGKVSEILVLLNVDTWVSSHFFKSPDTSAADTLPPYLQSMVENKQMNIMEALNAKFVHLSLNIISFVIVLILTWIIVRIIKKTIHLVSKTPILGTADKLGGAALGAAEAVVVILIVLSVIYVSSSFLDNNTLEQSINNSYLLKFLYENNPIIKMLTPEGPMDFIS